MRAGVRHDALAQVFGQLFQLPGCQGIIGLHRMPADRLGDHVLTQPQIIDLAPRSLELIDQFKDELPGLPRLDKWRQRVEQESSLPKFP